MLNIKRCNKNLAALLTSLLLLTGCASTPVSFNSREHVTDNLATVFIYRPDAMANILVIPTVEIDGATAFTLGNNQYQMVQLPAGQHTVKLGVPDRYQGNTALMLNTNNSQVYFLRIDTAIKFQQNRPYERSFNLLEVTEAQATPQIRLCKPAVIKTINPPAQTTTEKTPGYSSETFRNPFSHQATSD